MHSWKLDKKCSFLAANIECDIFGAVRVPAAFHERCGDCLPSQQGRRYLDEDSEHSSESSGGNAGVDDEMAENDLQFTITVSTLLVDKKTHGAFIPVAIYPPNREWNKGDELELR
uniref:Uncharacterized protein n=1 Tax=Daucus carota subsp. sativus TaxID=79200 RepID=A0A175YLA2_DAUCS